MTLPLSLSPLGVPGDLLSLLGGLVAPHSRPAGKGLEAGSAMFVGGSFGSLLGAVGTDASAGDPTAQLVQLVKRGTPISTIAGTLANQVADALQRLLPGSQLGSGALRTSLVASIRSALAPPANAPPGSSAATQVAALEGRLTQWLNGLARETNQQTGQQNDIAGSLLDANTAKELPAQQQGSNSTPAPLDVASLARGLLASAATALLNGGSLGGVPNGAPAARLPLPTAGWSGAADPRITALQAAAFQAAPILAAAPQGGSPLAPGGSPNGSAATPSSSPLQVATPFGSATAAQVSSASTPSDLLARMLARAAGVDAQRAPASIPTLAEPDAAAPVAAGTTAPQSAGTETSGLTASSFAAAAKLTAALTTAIAAASSDGRFSADTGSKDAAFAAPAAPAKTVSSPVQGGFSLAANLPSAPAAPAGGSAATATPSAFDPSALIEGLVKSMAMRSSPDGTSELRLRLQPESLGSVTMKLTVSGTNVTATAVAQNADARVALLASQQQLARSLAGAGLKLTGFTVDLSGGNAGREQPRDQTSGFGRRYIVHDVAGAAASEAADATESGLAIVSGPTLGLLSYLV